MNKPILSLLLLLSASASADWVSVRGVTDPASERWLDTSSVRQTGPMNTMRRVWEISNLAEVSSSKVLSIKTYREYDCKDRRVRMLEEHHFAVHGAQGEPLPGLAPAAAAGNWRDIAKGSVIEAVFYRVCPHDGSQTGKD